MTSSTYTNIHLLINFVSEALEKQGVKSCLSEDSYLDRQYCLYKDDRGNKCAVGHLIPISKYRLPMEHLDASSLCSKYPSVVESIQRKFKLTKAVDIESLLTQLQYIHDFNEPSDWKDQFNKLKDQYV